MKRLIVAALIGTAAVAFGYDTFDPHTAGEFNDYWDTRAYEVSVPVTATGTLESGGVIVAGRYEAPSPANESFIERAFKTSGIAELAIQIKRYAMTGLSIILK